MKINTSLISKSVAYGGRYSSATFNESHRALFGDNFCVSGFSLIELEETGGTGLGLTIKLGPGVFCSKGVFVKISGTTELIQPTTPQDPKIIVGHTTDNKEKSAVVIDMINPTSLTDNMAVLGYFTPSFNFTEEVDSGSYPNKHPFYKPASHVCMEELASDVGSGLRAESHVASDILSKVLTLTTGQTGYRLEVKNISLAASNSNLLVFYAGTLLEEGKHFYIESPGTLVLIGGVTLGYAGNVALTYESSYNNSFIDILYSEDFLFKQTSVYSYNSQQPEQLIDIASSHRELLEKGSYEPLVFVTQQGQTGGGTLLNPDRYEVISKNSEQGVRDAIKLKPRIGWESTNGGYISDDYDGKFISSITIIGVRGLSAVANVARPNDFPGFVPGTSNPESLIPIVDGNSKHGALPYKYLETKTPYKVESGELQVFIDGKLAPCEHFMVNKLSTTASGTPVLTGQGYQRYVSDKNSSAIEIGLKPIGNTREYGIAHCNSGAEEPFRNIATVNFRPSYLLPRTREFTYGSKSFNNLDEVATKPGITEALFNFTEERYFDSNASTFEFADDHANGAGFNGNYFVTYESLAGIETNQTSASRSILSTLTMSVTMFYDVPLGVGLALGAANELNYFAGSSATDSGWFDQAAWGDGYKTALDSEGNSLTDSTTGLYTKNVDPDKYFSQNNPIVTYAAMDAYLQPWMDCFGFHTDTTPSRSHIRNAGTTYGAEGEILTSFSNLLQENSNVGGDNRTLVNVIDSIADSLGAGDVPIGTAHGYAYGKTVVNLTRGKITQSFNPLQSPQSFGSGNKYPNVGGEFSKGIYFGNTFFANPFVPNDAASFGSDALTGYYGTNPNDCHYGLFSSPGAGDGYSNSRFSFGARSFTWNNINVIITPIPGGNHTTTPLYLCSYRFVYIDPISGILLDETPGLLESYFVANGLKPDIGFEIFAQTGAGGASRRHALVEWTAFGQLDKLDYGTVSEGEPIINSLTGDMDVGSKNEH